MKSQATLYELHHADAFEWLENCPKNSVHAVVTDPPFGVVEYHEENLRKFRSGNGGIWRIPTNFDGHQRSPVPRFTVLRPSDHEIIRKFHTDLARLLCRVLCPGAHVIMATHVLVSHLPIAAFTGKGFEYRGQIVRVVKTLRGGDRPKGAHSRYQQVSVMPRACYEPWLLFRKPCEGSVKENLKTWGIGGLRRPEEKVPFKDLISSGPARGEERQIAPHPSLKPQAFMRQIVHASLPLGKGVVLDPFMGSGSTIAAAKYNKYTSIGIEKDDQYFAMAVRAVPELAELTGRSNGVQIRGVK